MGGGGGGGTFGMRWDESRGITRRADSVSEQKTWSDGSQQPMGCGRGALECEGEGGRRCDCGWARARSLLVFLPCHITLVCSQAQLLSTPVWTAEHTHTHPVPLLTHIVRSHKDIQKKRAPTELLECSTNFTFIHPFISPSVHPICGSVITMAHPAPAHFLTNVQVEKVSSRELTRTKWSLSIPEDFVLMLGKYYKVMFLAEEHQARCPDLIKSKCPACTKLQMNLNNWLHCSRTHHSAQRESSQEASSWSNGAFVSVHPLSSHCVSHGSVTWARRIATLEKMRWKRRNNIALLQTCALGREHIRSEGNRREIHDVVSCGRVGWDEEAARGGVMWPELLWRNASTSLRRRRRGTFNYLSFIQCAVKLELCI